MQSKRELRLDTLIDLMSSTPNFKLMFSGLISMKLELFASLASGRKLGRLPSCTIMDEKGPSLQKALERAWIQHHGPPRQLCVDEGTGWASDATMQWCENNDIEIRISPGQVHTRTSIVERRHQIVRKAISIFMMENDLTGLDGVRTALSWVVPALNSSTFVNGYTPTQLALGREPALPGRLSDERTSPPQLQLTEQEKLHKRLQMKFVAQSACGKAEIDVKLRRALLRRFTGKDEELLPGERCYYWRDFPDKAHTIRWRGPAVVVVAVERNPDTGTTSVYWIAHGTVLLRAGVQHVRKMVSDSGQLGAAQRAQQALDGLRQRRAVRIIDLRKANKRSIDEVDPELSDYTPSIAGEPPAPVTMSSRLPDGVQRAFDRSTQEAIQSRAAERPSVPLVPDPPEDQPPEPLEPQLEERRPYERHPELPELDDDEFEEPMGEPAHMETPRVDAEPRTSLPDPADLPVPGDHDLDSPKADPPSRPMAETSSSSMPAPMAVDPLYAPPPAESFQDRRRRFDQETIWTRKKARTDEGDVDINLHGFDLTKSTPLPSGWTYDEKNNEFILGETQDWWSYEDGFLVRNHVWGRNTTYKPEEFFIDTSFLQTTTGLTLQQGSRTIYVNAKEQQHFHEHWTGKTLYPLTSEGAERTGLLYIGDLTDKLSRCKTLRGRGHIWQAVGAGNPKKKHVKESADLNERKMTLEDRLSFLEGKKAELMSIFENGVWETELDPQAVDHNRVMRARFVLKWAADGKGGLKAKARLVLQGFSDPDLLQGQLDTSSPTLSRSSRQVLIALSEVLSWERWTADVATAFLQGDHRSEFCGRASQKMHVNSSGCHLAHS